MYIRVPQADQQSFGRVWLFVSSRTYRPLVMTLEIRMGARSCTTGSVANVKMRERLAVGLTELGGGDESEQACNERNLPRDVALGQPSYLSLPDHVHHLDALNRSSR